MTSIKKSYFRDIVQEFTSIVRANIYFFAVNCLVLLLLVGICVIQHTSPAKGIVYFLYQFCGLFLPGLGLSLLINVPCSKKALSLISLSYGLGIFVVVIEYFILSWLKIRLLFPLFFVLLLIGSLTIIIQKRQILLNLEYDKIDWIFCILVITILELVCASVVSLVNTTPNLTGGTGYYGDFLYWIGNNISCVKGLPIQRFNLVGNVFRYHYLSSVLVAAESMTTTIDVVFISLHFSFIVPVLLFVFEGYNLFSSVISNKALAMIATILMLFTSGRMSSNHYYIAPFGFDYGYTLGMLSVFLAFELLKDFKQYRYAVLSIMIMFITTGLKGPIAITLLFGYFAYTLINMKKGFWRASIYGLGWLFSFLASYFLFISAASNVGGSGGVEFLGFEQNFQQNYFVQGLYPPLLNAYGDHSILHIYAIYKMLYTLNRAAIILFFVSFIALIANLIKKKKADAIHLFCCAVCFFGGILYMTVMQDGGSEIYFGEAIIPYGILGGMYAFDNAFKTTNYSLSVKPVITVLLAFVLLIAGNDYQNMYSSLKNKYYWGLETRTGKLYKGHYDSTTEFFISSDEYAGCLWIRENTPDSAIIAVDTFLDSENKNTHMLTGVFSERFVWNDGYFASSDLLDEVDRRQNIVAKAIECDEEAINQLKAENVSYLVQKLYSDSANDSINSEQFLSVFENEKMRVYKLK